MSIYTIKEKIGPNSTFIHIKNVLSTTTKADADKAYGEAVSIIDKAVSKNLIHKNTGSRRKAQITRHVNSLS